jgi:hypothetical protein
MRRIFHENGLSIVFFLLFFLSLIGQSLTGLSEYNEDQKEHGQPEVAYTEYLTTGHFIEATFENWESEFLQMAAFVVLTVFLYQKGSAESKDPYRTEEFDVVPAKSRLPSDAPAPVRRGGFVGKLYENSLGLAFLVLFLISMWLHAVGGAEEYNQDQMVHTRGFEAVTPLQYMGTTRFWFESFQNWQSEFLSVLAMVVFSIFLRQKGSPESKPMYTSHQQTED